MKKVININFQGRVIPIEETAYDLLQQYVDSLRRYFRDEEGRDEIINDIESRIAELMGETLKKGNTCITDADVEAIIASIGRPEDFDGEEEKVKSKVYEESGRSNYTYTKGERLYRSENDKVIAGVCSGIGHYFGIDPLIVRILFIIFAFGFGFGFIVYLVLWVAVPSTASTVLGAAKKRLLRDPDNKIIAGVCSGLGYYFGVNAWIPRVLFLIPFFSFFFRWNHWGAFDFPNFLSFSFSPASTIIYIILWLVLPEAKTTSERLEMKGEKVDINSIKNNISEEMKGVGERVSKFGKEAADFAQQTGKRFGGEVGKTARRSGRGLGNALALLIKIFVYFIIGAILFAIVSALFGLGVAVFGLLPLKGYILHDGWQTIFAWGSLLFIWVPVIAIITSIIRRIARVHNNSGVIRTAFLSLWILGLICVIGLITSVANDFYYENNHNIQTVPLSNPTVDKLEVKAARPNVLYNRFEWLKLEPFARIDEDTMYINNVSVQIIKANNDSFAIQMAKNSNGVSREKANELASRINYPVTQQDSTLWVPRGIGISQDEKFRNQSVILSIAVPVGKRIKIDNNVGGWEGRLHFGWHNDADDWRWNNDADYGYPWEFNVEYLMTNDGLKRVDGKVDNDNEENNNDTIQPDLQDFDRQRQQLEEQREQKRRELQQLDSVLRKNRDTIPSTPATPAKTAVILENNMTIPNILLSRFSI
ncbi:PspC domain-containing protein [Ilyomonas limi]|uniref:PspC domain-containing protein n=1 Tax=Ilyomonas limi TaxID=2575867 RepID=A0A4U3L1F2_9BACT|nr:PspC domain-containing protein [Ilyomonas limi]TKK68049.1 PspC domain-containing protein [Ilyomonas limi]